MCEKVFPKSHANIAISVGILSLSVVCRSRICPMSDCCLMIPDSLGAIHLRRAESTVQQKLSLGRDHSLAVPRVRSVSRAPARQRSAHSARQKQLARSGNKQGLIFLVSLARARSPQLWPRCRAIYCSPLTTTQSAGERSYEKCPCLTDLSPRADLV